MLLIGGSAVANGWGMNGPVIGFMAVLTFLMGATVSARLGLAVGAGQRRRCWSALAWAEHAGWIRGAAALVDTIADAAPGQPAHAGRRRAWPAGCW